MSTSTTDAVTSSAIPSSHSPGPSGTDTNAPVEWWPIAPSEAITEQDVERYTQGACDALAFTVSQRTGWPVVLCGDGPGGVMGWVHAAVRRPDGRILDVEGLWDEMGWVMHWGEQADGMGHDLDGYDGDDVWVYPAAECGVHGHEHPAVIAADAERVADILLAEFGPGL